MMLAPNDYDPNDDEPWVDNYQYQLLKQTLVDGAIDHYIPLDDNHVCPVCNGKGYIRIVKGK